MPHCCLRFLPAQWQYQPKLPCSKKPKCKCCDEYAAYLRGYGFDVDVRITDDLAQISSQAGIPKEFQGCHTMFVDGYVVKASFRGTWLETVLGTAGYLGITLPGMPARSPGMAGEKRGEFIINAVAKDGAPPGIDTVE